MEQLDRMDQGRRARKPMVFAFTAVATLVVVSSVAFACVQTRGRITVVGSLGSRSSAIGNGFHPGPGNVEFCNQPQVGARVPQPTGFGPSQRPTVNLSVGPATGNCAILGAGSFAPGQPNVLADGNYDVMFCDGVVFVQNENGKVKNVSENRTQAPGTPHGSCYFWDAVDDRGTLMGQLTVGGSTGSGQYLIPAGATRNGPTNWAGVSIRRTGPAPQPGGGPPHVNMAPISII